MRRLNKLVEGSIFIALSIVLSIIFELVPVFNMPQGGHISLSMLPLFIYAFRNGIGYGLLAGFTYGILNFVIDGASYGLISLFADYLIAFTVIGLAGVYDDFVKKDNVLSYIVGILAILLLSNLRLLAHVISGVYSFESTYQASFIYNFGYMAVSSILTVIFFIILKDLLITKRTKIA